MTLFRPLADRFQQVNHFHSQRVIRVPGALFNFFQRLNKESIMRGKFRRFFSNFKWHLIHLTLISAFISGLFGQSATPIPYPVQLFSSYRMMEAQAVPTTPTVISATNMIWVTGWISCNSTQSITLTDGNGKNILPAIPQTAPAFWALNVLAGAYISGGFSLSASGSGCLYHAVWKS